jgi:hypothetical protein
MDNRFERIHAQRFEIDSSINVRVYLANYRTMKNARSRRWKNKKDRLINSHLVLRTFQHIFEEETKNHRTYMLSPRMINNPSFTCCTPAVEYTRSWDSFKITFVVWSMPFNTPWLKRMNQLIEKFIFIIIQFIFTSIKSHKPLCFVHRLLSQRPFLKIRYKEKISKRKRKKNQIFWKDKRKWKEHEMNTQRSKNPSNKDIIDLIFQQQQQQQQQQLRSSRSRSWSRIPTTK